LIGIWVQALRVPRNILYPIILFLAIIGVYHVNNNWFDVGLLFIFGMIGYIFRKLDCETTPLAMGFIIGAMFEEYFRRSLAISQGDWATFVERPISLTLLIISVIFVVAGVFFRTKLLSNRRTDSITK